jgi:adenine-specific DNA-methyltransferase
MARKKTTKKAADSVPVDALKHVADKRSNIPTRELAGFAKEEEAAPKTVLYPRDPSLDPQLVWKGKDEQDARPLEVPAVPIYLQEKVHPLALIEDLKARAAVGKPRQADLFSDFNGLDDFQKKVEFYQHDQHWTNRLILGDSLLVMTSLAEKERLKGKVQMIYLDPPYGIKFGSNWQVSTRKRDVKDAKAEDLTRQPEQIKAFRDTWELGIHSYLTYLRERLTAARELLTESGSIFVQIGDENAHLVRCLMDEVFGSENCVTTISYKSAVGMGAKYLDSVATYIVWFAKNIQILKYRPIYRMLTIGEPGATRYLLAENNTGEVRRLSEEEQDRPDTIADGWRPFFKQGLTSRSGGSTTEFAVTFEGKKYYPTAGGWRTNAAGVERLIAANRIAIEGNRLTFKRYFSDFAATGLNNIWDDISGGIKSRSDPKVYVVQTSTSVVDRCLLMTTDPGDLVLDPTCGSGTTAYVAEQWGRRWIAIDTSRVAQALARTRLMAGRFPYYLLADSPEGRKKLAELSAEPTPADAPLPRRDVRQGFVYRAVPHVTLKSIANNPDIKEGMTPEQINAAIARHADTETLYDQPYEDKGTVRLTGPFTVESLSPHRMLPAGDGAPGAPNGAPADARNYTQSMLDNLRKAGVKGTVKSQRIGFERLDTFPGEYIQAEGVTDAGAAVRVSIGPEFGTVGDQWIKAAALEAIRGSRCDLLLVCAFAFEASVHEQTAELSKEMQFGKLRVLPVRMNPDLAMGDELLKKTGAGNLFTVFGEPDVKIERDEAGQVTVTVRGVDVFDPTTGEVRSGGTDDIACWFIDTDYDGQSFFVRHAYFCGAGEPYEKLKKALRAEIDEGEWAKLYTTTSLPFQAPKGGKIAVKVINHYGDEVLKVFRVP